MQKFISFIVLCGICSASFAGGSALLQAETSGAAVPQASAVYPIYEGMRRLGLPNQSGHTMAAGLLTQCLGGRTVIEQVNIFDQTLRALMRSQVPAIRVGAAKLAPQITYSAATLVCRMGIKTPQTMVALLEVVYTSLLRDGYVDWLPNVVTAANLVNVGPIGQANPPQNGVAPVTPGPPPPQNGVDY